MSFVVLKFLDIQFAAFSAIFCAFPCSLRELFMKLIPNNFSLWDGAFLKQWNMRILFFQKQKLPNGSSDVLKIKLCLQYIGACCLMLNSTTKKHYARYSVKHKISVDKREFFWSILMSACAFSFYCIYLSQYLHLCTSFQSYWKCCPAWPWRRCASSSRGGWWWAWCDPAAAPSPPRDRGTSSTTPGGKLQFYKKMFLSAGCSLLRAKLLV